MELQEAVDLVEIQKQELEIQASKKWSNIVVILSAAEKIDHVGDSEFIDALESKYETLKDKLILEALERRHGHEEWSELTEIEKFNRLMEVKLQIKSLLDQGDHIHMSFICP